MIESKYDTFFKNIFHSFLKCYSKNPLKFKDTENLLSNTYKFVVILTRYGNAYIGGKNNNCIL